MLQIPDNHLFLASNYLSLLRLEGFLHSIVMPVVAVHIILLSASWFVNNEPMQVTRGDALQRLFTILSLSSLSSLGLKMGKIWYLNPT